MPKGQDWLNLFYINVAFISQFLIIYMHTKVNLIEQNWAKHRCNPIYMPFSKDIEKDFTYCVQTTQANYMGYLLQPIQYMLKTLSVFTNDMGNSVNFIRIVIANMRNFTTSIVTKIFGIFLNLIIEFQKITISIKDLVGKTVGVVTAMLYIMDGSMKTMQSVWDGPPGQTVKFLGRHCFHPDTSIILKNGSSCAMKNLKLQDVLLDESVVEKVIQIFNTHREPFYRFSLSENDILVTGTHMIYDNNKDTFVMVKDHPDSKKTDIVSDYLMCISTNTHHIPINEYIFWDWDDDCWKQPIKIN